MSGLIISLDLLLAACYFRELSPPIQCRLPTSSSKLNLAPCLSGGGIVADPFQPGGSDHSTLVANRYDVDVDDPSP
jgi:hypothetical protein